MRTAIAALAAVLALPAANAAVITFEELGALGSLSLSVGTRGGLNFGTLFAFDAVATGFDHMADTAPNAAILESGSTYSITRDGVGTFDFIGADFARSHADSALYQLAGFRGGIATFSLEVSAEPGFPDHQRIAAGWTAIDELRITFGPSVTTGFAAMDNFEFELTPVPLPATWPALIGALAVVVRRRAT